MNSTNLSNHFSYTPALGGPDERAIIASQQDAVAAAPLCSVSVRYDDGTWWYRADCVSVRTDVFDARVAEHIEHEQPRLRGLSQHLDLLTGFVQMVLTDKADGLDIVPVHVTYDPARVDDIVAALTDRGERALTAAADGRARFADCARCENGKRTRQRCWCRAATRHRTSWWRFLLSLGRRPFPPCDDCGGTGSIACRHCDGHGRILAHLAITVVNIDTGELASAEILPGAITPTPIEGTDRFGLSLRQSVDDLAQRTGSAHIEHYTDFTIPLGKEYTPDLPADERERLEITALTALSARHRLYQGRSQPPAEVPAGDKLAALCRTAHHLCLDVVVLRTGGAEGKPAKWLVTLQPAGLGLPPGAPRGFSSLTKAIAKAHSADLLGTMDLTHTPQQRGDTPARFIQPADHTDRVSLTAVGTITGLERQLEQHSTQAGAVAIWRDGAWHYSAVTATPAPRAKRTSNREAPTWQISQPPAAPTYWADPIASIACGCASNTGHRGPHQCCTVCGDVQRQFHGLVVTITDMESAQHINLNADDAAVIVPVKNSVMGGGARFQLPDRYRLATYLRKIGVGVGDVTDTFGIRPSSVLLDGTVTAPSSASPDEVARIWCATAAQSHPAARVFIRTRPPRTEKLSTLARIAHGLGFDLVVACQASNREDGSELRWGVKLFRPTASSATDPHLLPSHPYLAAAVGDALDRLDSWYHLDQQPPANRPCTLPQRSAPLEPDIDAMEACQSRLAALHPFDVISIRIASHQVTAMQCVAGSHFANVLAHGPTVTQVMTTLKRLDANATRSANCGSGCRTRMRSCHCATIRDDVGLFVSSEGINCYVVVVAPVPSPHQDSSRYRAGRRTAGDVPGGLVYPPGRGSIGVGMGDAQAVAAPGG